MKGIRLRGESKQITCRHIISVSIITRLIIIIIIIIIIIMNS